jgi:DNA-binding MarR family transcriptional regulator
MIKTFFNNFRYSHYKGKVFSFLFVINIFITIFLSFQTYVIAPESNNKLNSSELYFITPNGNVILRGNETLEWKLEDQFIDNSTQYNLEYSPNNGNSWVSLIFYLQNNTFLWQTNLYAEYNTKCLLKVTAVSKNWLDKVVVTNTTFTIDNRDISSSQTPINSSENESYRIIITVLLGFSLIFGSFFYLSRNNKANSALTAYIRDSSYDNLKTLKNKVVIGLENYREIYNSSFIDIPVTTSIENSRSLNEFFPIEFRENLIKKFSGRTVLVLIEIAYINPGSRNPGLISKNLEIPLSTISKEIKKLRELEYIQYYITNDNLFDARERNFTITPKGFRFLFTVNEFLKITLKQIRERNVNFENHS